MKYVIVSGGFDPIHSGHIELLKKASSLGDKLIVGVNSDAWLSRKKGKPFMPFNERKKVLESIKWVDEVWEFDDSDNSACKLLESVIEYTLRHSNIFDPPEIIFANGGDRTEKNIPEMKVNGVEFVFGIGGDDKKNSSSWLLEEWKCPKTERPWGYYRVLHENGKEVKVKELTVEPGQSLSMQKHELRSEHWFIVEGDAEVYTINKKSDQELVGIFHKHQSLHIKKSEWHQLCNPGNTPLKMVEIQYGEKCEEEDIERTKINESSSSYTNDRI
jgi:cytidyltransferase-like protein